MYDDDHVVVAALTRVRRDVDSELVLTAAEDGVPADCVVSFDNVNTIPRRAFRRPVVALSPRAASAARTARRVPRRVASHAA